MTFQDESSRISANQWGFLGHPDRYVKASTHDRKLVRSSTRRQFRTARDILQRLNGSYRAKANRGLLLADDVGLGKTTVAALVAWVFASASGKTQRRVRILSPNDVMKRRWEEEMKAHVSLLAEVAPHLSVSDSQIKVGKSAVSKLHSGAIQITTHSYATKGGNLSCDLLIVDEAHRAKGDASMFSRALRRQSKNAGRILILTATPFSIHLEELVRMLQLIGGNEASGAVKAYSRELHRFYTTNSSRSVDDMARRLVNKAKCAIEALKPFVIRHGIDDLTQTEQRAFGKQIDTPIQVPEAAPRELELMLRMDRALILEKANRVSAQLSNDPRFHVGWRHFDDVLKTLGKETQCPVVTHHVNAMVGLRRTGGAHPKMRAVGERVKQVVAGGEKVLVFCNYHRTAEELTLHLDGNLPRSKGQKTPRKNVWIEAWDELIEPDEEDRGSKLRETLIEWLCSDNVRMQTRSWLEPGPRELTSRDLQRQLQGKVGRCDKKPRREDETIAVAAQRLYRHLVRSRSSRGVLRRLRDEPEQISWMNNGRRVVGLCEAKERQPSLFVDSSKQPDTLISIFNSPFGPDVFVVTDRLSEGIDLHRYCRHLIHYELDPSPIRTVQRNGRVRRVNSWAAMTEQPIEYSFPAFRGTRDQLLVQIMSRRLKGMSMLLGGVPDFSLEEIVDAEESLREEAIEAAKGQLESLGGSLRARGNPR